MQVNAKNVNKANAKVSTTISADVLEAKVNQLAKEAAKTANIAGFRKGHVPASLMLQKYRKEIEGDAKNRVLGDIVGDGLKELGKGLNDTIGEPLVTKFDEKNGNIDVEITISFRPEVDIKGYESLLPAYEAPKVEQKEIDERIDNMLKIFGSLEKSSKEELGKGDFAKFDFEGFVDGKTFEGGKAENYILEIGSGQFIPGFEDGMMGLKVGGERDIKVTFPAEYGAAHLAGKDAVFKVKLHEIQEQKKAELNEETLKKIMPNEQNPSKEMLEASIKDQIRTSKFITLLNGEIKDKFAQALTKKFNFDLPENIIDQEMNVRFRNDWYSFSDDERKKYQEDKKAFEAKLESYKEEASNSVKLTFIIDELAKVNKIEVSDQELIQTIYMEAYRSGRNPKEHMEYYKKGGMLPAVKMAIVEEKLFLHLFPLPEDEQIEKAKKASSVKKEAEPKAAEKKPTSKKAAESTEEKPKRGRKKKKEE
ncbi:MAG: trigger factor [Campylobacter sp.]|uniref:trigger factor n=1 Tax=Campylobacter sp. TaxID=205 RepID=UPI002AA60B7B|nr:trigger factor [Campylobacter sp.]MCI6694820.1 trigger factor [Campylobacter sp.]